MSIEVLTGELGSSAGAIGWPSMMHVVQDEGTGAFEYLSPALQTFGLPSAPLHPAGLTAALAEKMNFRMKQVRLTGGVSEVFSRHTHPNYPSDGDEALLGGWPGINVHQAQEGTPYRHFRLQVGFLESLGSTNFQVGGYYIGDGNPWPVACDWLLYPYRAGIVQWWTVPGDAIFEVHNVVPLPPACIFDGDTEYPLVYLDWVVGHPSTTQAIQYTTYPWSAEGANISGSKDVGLDIEDTGRVLDVFGMGTTPIYCFYNRNSGPPPSERALADDVRLEAHKWFTYGGLYDEDTGELV